MNINDFRIKYRDVVIVLTINEIIEKGIDAVINSEYKNSKGIGEEVRRCASDMKESYNNDYNNLRAVIKRCL